MFHHHHLYDDIKSFLAHLPSIIFEAFRALYIELVDNDHADYSGFPT